MEEEIIKEEWFKKIIHQVAEDELDEDEAIEDCPEKGVYIVEYTEEIQHMGLREDWLGGEEEFGNLEDALDFYDTLDEPDEYRAVYDSDGFRWER